MKAYLYAVRTNPLQQLLALFLFQGLTEVCYSNLAKLRPEHILQSNQGQGLQKPGQDFDLPYRTLYLEPHNG